MTKFAFVVLAAGLAAGTTAFAQDVTASGDAAAGEAVFNQCVACHVVTNDAGETLAGRNGRVGPNLYNIAGRAAGSIEGFRYSPAMQAAGEAGIVWDEANFVAYLQNVNSFLQTATGDARARGAMALRDPGEQAAKDVYAYLVSLSAQ